MDPEVGFGPFSRAEVDELLGQINDVLKNKS
jgi:hypothetical protein